jgi:hypothetical protein
MPDSGESLIENQPPANANEPISTGNMAAVNAATEGIPAEVPLDAPANIPANSANPAAALPASAEAPAAQPAAAIPGILPTDGSRVKYAKRKLQKHSQPGGTGQVVGELDRGDHPLVIKDADWSQLSNGTFVENEGLSEQGIGRKAEPSSWR